MERTRKSKRLAEKESRTQVEGKDQRGGKPSRDRRASVGAALGLISRNICFAGVTKIFAGVTYVVPCDVSGLTIL